MRTFHTNTSVCGYPHDISADSVGRPPDHAGFSHTQSAVHPKNPKKESYTRRFSMGTKTDAMLSNLHQCSDYISLQLDSLSKIEGLLGLQKSVLFTPDNPLTNSRERAAQLKIMHSSLLSVIDLKYGNHPIFGYGYESPVRLHLVINGKRESHSLPVVPLLSKPGFKSFEITLGAGRDISTGLRESCLEEVLNLMMDVHKNEVKLTALENKLKASSKKLDGMPGIKNSRPFFSNLISKILIHLNYTNPKSTQPVPT